MNNWRSSREYRTWRVHVIRRDKVCQVCRSKKNRHAHHLNDASSFEELRYVIENGIVLCGYHHTMFHTSYKRNYSESCTDKDYDNFMELYGKISQDVKDSIIRSIENAKI